MFDEKEYIKIYNKHYLKIYQYCLTELDAISAEECANNVMVDLYRKWDRLKKGDKIEHWLFKAARISVLNKKTSLAKEKAAYSLLMENELENLASDITDEEIRMINLDTELLNIAEQLPIKLRMLFVLRFIEKLSVKQVAERMNMPYSTTRINLQKSMDMAKQIVEKNYS